MERHPNDLTTDEQIDAALERAKTYNPVRITNAVYRPERELDLFVLTLSDGRRLSLPRESLQFVAEVSPEQAAKFVIGQHKTDIWWPELDEGFTLAGLLEGRTGNDKWMEKLRRVEVAA